MSSGINVGETEHEVEECLGMIVDSEGEYSCTFSGTVEAWVEHGMIGWTCPVCETEFSRVDDRGWDEDRDW